MGLTNILFKKTILIFTIMFFTSNSRAGTEINGNRQSDGKIEFFPVQHASFVIGYTSPSGIRTTIFVDPTGEAGQYKIFGIPDIILVTHEHGDHFDAGLLTKVKGDKSEVIVTENVYKKLGFGRVMANGAEINVADVQICAIPMYNMTPDRLRYHQKGAGNGYVLTIGGKRVYISGDTEDIPEMRSLKNIDYAFICMNLPYTMDAAQAASAVLEFKPANVYPYHYRSQSGDGEKVIAKFKDMVSVNPNISVHLLKWY